MTTFEEKVCMISRIDNNSEAISIHRTAVYLERFNALYTDLEYLLLDNSHYNAVMLFRKEHNYETMIDDMSVIWHFRKNPTYSHEYLQNVLIDGNKKEISLVKMWIKQAKLLGQIKRRTIRKA